MLGDFKTIIDVLLAVFKVGAQERERTTSLLKEISAELDSLAEVWRKVLIEIESGDDRFPPPTLSALVYQQRGSFEALRTFVRHAKDAPATSPLRTPAGHEFLWMIEGAINEKGKLYTEVHRVVFPGQPVIESSSNSIDAEYYERRYGIKQFADPNAPDVPAHEAAYLRFRQRYAENEEREAPKRRAAMVAERDAALMMIRASVAKLGALAGQFRTSVNLYGAHLTR